MRTMTTSRSIHAPPEEVFEVIAHPERFAEVAPAVTGIEFLGEKTRGAGTRFRETRLLKGREATTELEVTEYEPSRRVRIVSDAGGTVWDTIFEVIPDRDWSLLALTMQARPHRLLARVFVPLMMRRVRKGIEADMDAVKEHCEGGRPAVA